MNAQAFLKSMPVVDAHFDMLADVLYLRRQGEHQVINNKFMPAFRSGGVNVVVAAIFIETLFVPDQALEMALEQIDYLHQEIEESPGRFRLCSDYSQIENAILNGELAILLSLEGAEPINGNLSLLHTFHRLGVRLLGPAWARRNAACDGSTLVNEDTSSAGGLTPFGRELVQEAELLGMVLDVSHLNDKGVFDLFKVSNRPLLASHSNARALHPIERNISDEIIQEIARRNGVVGVNAVNTICAAEDSDATPEMLIGHMDHIRSIGGVGSVGLGMDFFGGMNMFAPVLPPQKMKRRIYDVVDGHGGLPQLAETMSSSGWTTDDIQAVMGGNFLRLFSQVFKS